jgi:hypothetical protein
MARIISLKQKLGKQNRRLQGSNDISATSQRDRMSKGRRAGHGAPARDAVMTGPGAILMLQLQNLVRDLRFLRRPSELLPSCPPSVSDLHGGKPPGAFFDRDGDGRILSDRSRGVGHSNCLATRLWPGETSKQGRPVIR